MIKYTINAVDVDDEGVGDGCGGDDGGSSSIVWEVLGRVPPVILVNNRPVMLPNSDDQCWPPVAPQISLC